MITTIRILSLLTMLFLTQVGLLAQSDTLPDSKGKDFWFCFLPNFHNSNSDGAGIDDRIIQLRDSLYIFVAAEKPTNVTLEYRDSAGTTTTRTFSITDPTKVLSIGEQFYPYELIGFNRCGAQIDLSGGQNMRIAKQSFHLWSDEEVTVYAMDQALRTSDAFLVLPSDAIGNSYYVLSYPADPATPSQATPSQFAVVAAEDNTVVRFEMPQDGLVFRYFNPPDSIVLNKGDVYLIQSNTGNYNELYDLTGTRVVASKPIALFSGHQRALLPIERHSNLSSRDCLIEQLTPISTWGHGSLLVPYPEPRGALMSSGDKYRILAAYDSTEVWIDSVYVKLLNAGEYMEGDLVKPHSVFCTRAVEIAQYKHTSTPSYVRDTVLIGDPFMMVIPPSNQFLKSYRFVNVQAVEPIGPLPYGITYKEQWLTVVLPTKFIPTLRIDGKTATANFVDIPKSEYSYAWVRMTDGVHTVSADTGVGILVYGYGAANSYGYVGGMAYKRYDFNPPQVFGKPDCVGMKGSAYDTTLADTKLISLKLMKDSISNVNVDIDPFIPPSDSIHFQATLIDPNADGYFKLEARDLEGYVTRQRLDVPGYTLRIVALDSSLQLDRTESFKPGPDRTYCNEYLYVNIGKFPHTVYNMTSALPNSSVSVARTLPYTVKPKDTLRFTVCHRFHDFGDYDDSVMVDVGCPPRTLIRRHYNVGIDTVKPTITAAASVCGDDKQYILSDMGAYQTGLRAVKIVDTMNCSILGNFNVDSTRIRVHVNDWKLDAWFSLEVADSSGNFGTITDTLPGFTVMYSNIDSLTHALRLSDTYFRESVCDTIEFYNYGRYPKSYSSLPLSQNTRFSIPQHQLPLVLMPGERRRIGVCAYFNDYNKSAAGDNIWRDSLMFSENCHVRELDLSSALLVREFNGITRCDIPVGSNNEQTPVGGIYSLYPQPSSEDMTLVLRLTTEQNYSLRVVSQMGQVVDARNFYCPAGDYALNLSCRGIESGIYTLVVQGDKGVVGSIRAVVIH